MVLMLTPGDISMVQGFMVREWLAAVRGDLELADLAEVCCAWRRLDDAGSNEFRSGCATTPLADRRNDLRFMSPLTYPIIGTLKSIRNLFDI
jgi:hypothetical protein